MRVNFSVEELKTIRDSIRNTHDRLSESSGQYKGTVGAAIDERILELKALHQRLVGVVIEAEELDESEIANP